MELQSTEDKKRSLDKQIDILFIIFTAIILLFGLLPIYHYIRVALVNESEVAPNYHFLRIFRDVIFFFCLLISFFLRFVLKRKKAQQLLFCISFYLYMFSLIYTVKINYSIPFFAIMAVILLIQLIDINSLFKTYFLIFTMVLYIGIGYLQLSGIKDTQSGEMDFTYHTLLLNSIFFTVFLIATYLLNKKNQIIVEEKYAEIVEEKIETIDQLSERLDHQHKEVDFMQTAKAGFGNTLIAIQQENSKLYNYLIKNKQKLKYEDIYLYSYKIKDTLTKFIDTLAPEQVRQGLIDYDLILDKPNYTLLISKSGNTYKVPLSETFLNIIEELMRILVADIENNVMNDRGYTDKIEFEKKLFQGITDANRLNSNVTRIRKELRNLGLDPKLIETKHHRIRLNTVSNKVEIIDL